MLYIDFAEWKKLVAQAAGHVADKDYQARSWFGQSTEINSPDEMFCRLFDDLDFKDFLDVGNNLTCDQKLLGQRLLELMNTYGHSSPTMLNPYDVFDDPRWSEIRAAARDFSISLL